MDIHMPGMSGMQVAQFIRKQEAASQGRRIPIVAISADAGVTLGECIAHGMDGLCNIGGTAPFQEVLMTVVRYWLQSYRKSPRKSPDLQKEAESAIESPKKQHPQSGPKILVVEDNIINQQVVCKFLEKAGYTNYEVAGNGKEAVELVLQRGINDYTIILMDCQMPEMDGYEATEKIRAFEVKNNMIPVPIIAMTAHAMATDKDKCLACGMTDYLMKPIQRVVLLDMLHKYLPLSSTF
jgi:CheY-like chemotaxis protein